VITQHERRDVEMKEPEWLVDMPCMLPLCHPFTVVVAGPTCCGKTAWVLRLIDNVREKTEPVPTRIWYYYGEHQPVFNNYPQVHFEDGLPQLNDEVFDAREPTMIVVDDHMSDVNQLVADIFTKISHHRNISILYLTRNLFDKNKYARIISLNAHYLVIVQKSSRCWTICNFCETDISDMLEVCPRGVRGRYEHAVWLSTSGSKTRSRRTISSQNECFFPGRCSTCMFASKGIGMLGRQWMAIYVKNNVHYGEWLRCRPFRAFECHL